MRYDLRIHKQDSPVGVSATHSIPPFWRSVVLDTFFVYVVIFFLFSVMVWQFLRRV